MVLERISRDDMLMQIAWVMAQRGTCSRAKVGAVFSRDGRIISTGYNGAPAGMPHCEHEEWTWPHGEDGDWLFPNYPEWMAQIIQDTTWETIPEGQIWYFDGQRISTGANAGGCSVVEHAERNAIAYAARYGVALDGSELHCTHAPCLDCARSIVNSGIKKVTYEIPYRLTDGVEFLAAAKIQVVAAIDSL